MVNPKRDTESHPNNKPDWKDIGGSPFFLIGIGFLLLGLSISPIFIVGVIFLFIAFAEKADAKRSAEGKPADAHDPNSDDSNPN